MQALFESSVTAPSDLVVPGPRAGLLPQAQASLLTAGIAGPGSALAAV